jgi:hypothetical protein
MLLVERTRIGISRHAQVCSWTTAIFVADVLLASITGQDENFLGRVEDTRFTKAHVRNRRYEAAGAACCAKRRLNSSFKLRLD